MGITPNHTDQKKLTKTVEEAKKKIKPGSNYYHYKTPKTIYTIIEIGLLESDEKPVVIYKNEFGLIWVRYVENFLEKVTVEGKQVPRFHFLKKV